MGQELGLEIQDVLAEMRAETFQKRNQMTKYEDMFLGADINDFIIRLIGGKSPNEGVIQYRKAVNDTEKWHTLCSSEYSDVQDAAFWLCHLAGYSVCCGIQGLNVSTLNATLVDELADFALGEFSSQTSDGQPCTLDDAFWLTDPDLQLKLEHGYHEDEGILQARCTDKQQWRPVCGDFWLDSSHVHHLACRYLGYPESVLGSAFVVPDFDMMPTGHVGLYDIFCVGWEDNLTDCLIFQQRFHCSNYAGLVCSNERPSIQLRLVDGKHKGSGVLQGRSRPTDDWGAICSNHWYGRDSQVACRHLGFLGQVTVTESQITGESRTNVSLAPEWIFLSAVGCLGNETELSQCDLVSDPGFSCNGFPYVECMEETKRFDVPAYLCGKINYCAYECDPDQFDPGFTKDEVCKCDDACVYFNDCCYDYRANCNPVGDWREILINGVSLEHYSCNWVPGYYLYGNGYESTGYALVSSCPNMLADSILRQNCERKAGPDDLIGLLPVYVLEGAVYKNIYCALCHGIKAEHLHKWKASVEYMEGHNVTYYPHLNLTIKGTPTGRIMFSPPRSSSGLQGSARRCPVKTTGTCLEEYKNTTLEEACKDYFALVEVDGFRYHNPHCAMCNGLTVQPTATCGGQGCRSVSEVSVLDKWGEPFLDKTLCFAPPFLSVEVLFDFGWGNKESGMCSPGELFDPLFGRCRTVLRLPAGSNENGDHFLQGLQTPNHSSSGWFPQLSDDCNAVVLTSVGNAASYWEAVPKVDTVLDNDTRYFAEEFSLSIFVKAVDKSNTFLRNTMMIFENSAFVFGACNITTATIYLEEGALAFSEIDVCSNASIKSRRVVQTSLNDNCSFILDSTVLKLLTWTGKGKESTGRVSLSVQRECLDILELLQDCSDVHFLKPDEYMIDNSQLSVWDGMKYGIKHHVTLPDGSVALCGSIDHREFGQFVLGMVSLVCSCMSLFALAATLVTYCALPELRNTIGLYNMNLVLALFVTILVTILSWALELKGYACAAAASVSHWLWLSAFFWMTTVSYNAARTFGGIIVVVPSRSKPKYRRLLVSMAFAWGGALLVVSICLLLNFCNCTDLPPIYSESQPCWIAGTTVRLVVFGIPVALSLLVGTVAFATVIFKIRKAKKDSKMVRTRRQIEETFDELKIYGKLMLLFGTSWILAFVSEAANHVVLSYINTILNTLQGVFIFLAFCLNQRVRALWRKSRYCFACRKTEQRKSKSNVPLPTVSTRGGSNVKSGAATVGQETN